MRFILRYRGKGAMPNIDLERIKNTSGICLVRQTSYMLLVDGDLTNVATLTSIMPEWTATMDRGPVFPGIQNSAPSIVPLPESQFPVIYADPPWAYRKEPLNDLGAARAVEKEYATMSPEEIAALPIAQLATPDAVLFMWATGPKLPQALSLMSAWSFEYRTIAFVWIKLTTKSNKPFFGMGFYTRANAEIVLVGTRGKGRKRIDAAVPQVVLDVYDGPEEEPIAAPVGAHSKKPDEVRQRIERLYEGPRIELFARERIRDWTVWGNDPLLK